MNQSRRTPLRSALDQLTQDFAAAVLQAVRVAVLEDLERSSARASTSRGRVASEPAGEPAQPPVAAAPKSPRAPKRTAPTRRQTPAASRVLDPVETYADEGVIVDPTAILGLVEEAQRAPAVPYEPRRREAREPALLRDVVVPDEPGENTPRREDAPAVEAASAPRVASPALRPGEQVLRAAGGGVVLRRKMGSASR